MTGTIKRTTDRYNLRIPIFDAPGWGREMERNMDIIDAAIFIATGFGSILGVWVNSTSYDEGSRVIDETDGTLWLAKITHTSNSSGSFAADRAANPTYWEQITNTSIYRGTWASSVVYNENEFVSDGYRYGIVTGKYTSGVSYDADVVAGNIVTLIDLTTAVTTASTAKDDAVTAKNDAVAAQTAAENARDTATTKANNAANSATTATNAANAASADATQVTTDKGIVLGYKNDASNAKIAAEAAQTAAESARDQTLSTLDSFDDRYLGAKAADPTTDNDGNALIGGALYYNTTNGVMMVYTGASWVSAYVDGNSFYDKVQSDARFLGINAKAADADKLNGQGSTYYLNAGNMNAGTLPSGRLAGTYAISITGSAAKLNNAIESISGVADTIAKRNSNGDLTARLFQYGLQDVTSDVAAAFMTMQGIPTGGGFQNIYPTTPAQVTKILETLGLGQSWIDVTASRDMETTYQNTTGRAIMVNVHGYSFNATHGLQISDGVSWTTVAKCVDSMNNNTTGSFIVPAGYFYRALSTFINLWMEYR